MKEYEFEGISHYRLPLCTELAGNRFSLVMDNGKTYGVDFISGSEVISTSIMNSAWEPSTW